MSEVTRILKSDDPQSAEELLPLVYEELRKMAAAKMSKESPGQTIQATALVHEVWLRLSADRKNSYNNRSHFYGAAAEVMRRILVDRARRRNAKKHGGDAERLEFSSVQLPSTDDELILSVNDALRVLAAKDSQKADVVKLRFFVGLSEKETAKLMGISERTVRRQWTYAKAWLTKEFSSNS